MSRSANPIIPTYDVQVPLTYLKEQGAVSLLTINATSFRKVAMEFGPEAYKDLQEAFHETVLSLWGSDGHFRARDLLMRKATGSNVYLIILEQSRVSETIPAPGDLERIADRILMHLQAILWRKIFFELKSRRLPKSVHVIPKFAVGFATVIDNPCVDSFEQIEHLIDQSFESSRIQMRRLEDRQRELIQSLIRSRDMLVPNYQAVFLLPGLTRDMIEASHQTESIAPLKTQLFGFESLIRVRTEIFSERMKQDVLFKFDPSLLRPDILFGLATQAKVSLELDQVCLSLGIANGRHLPGALMVNILPRNLYHIENLKHLIAGRGELIFELSESEAVNNFELMQQVRDHLRNLHIRIAADDFGKGHASFERIMKIKPDMIKLDRTLIDKIDSDSAKRSFVQGIIDAARHVHATVLAEGVERWEEAAVVQSMGVDLIQGFLLHKPQEAQQISEDLMESGSTADGQEEAA